jgi:DNA-binding PadR family transcriptional regulator
MKIELAYKKLLEEHKLTVEELPQDAMVGIDAITDIMKGVHLLSKKGKEPTPKIISKIRLLDKWTCQEILDVVNETEDNAPVEKVEEIKEAVKEEIKEEIKEAKEEQKPVEEKESKKEEIKEEKKEVHAEEKVKVSADVLTGNKVESELASLFGSGKTALTLEQIKQSAPVCYDVIFSAYESGSENGIETSNYILKETESEKFNLTKK